MSLSAASERVPSAPSAPSAPPAPSAASHSLKSLHIQQFSEISEQPALHEWMQLIHTALKQIQTSTANQCLMIQDLQSSVAAQSAALHAVGLGSISETSETPSQLAVHASEIPPSAPREEENVKKQRKCQSDPLGSLSMAKQSQLRESKRENRLNFELPNSLGLRDLEDLNANQLLSGFRPIRPGKRHPSALLVPCPSSPLQSPEALEAFGEHRPKSLNSKTRGEEKALVLSKGRMSMDELRMHHDEVTVVANRTGPGYNKGNDGNLHSLPVLGRFLLCFSGHMQFGNGLASHFFAFFSYAILPLAVSIVLLCTADIDSKWSFTKSVTLCCFQTGLSLASHNLKSNGFDLLLGPKDHQLDEYAVNAEFMSEWQSMSRRRLMQTLGAYAVLAALVAIVNFLSEAPVPSLTSLIGCHFSIFEAAFWLMQFRYLMLCYSLLHVGCGFELALDSFTLSFFKSMSIEDALEEWNILQATLRQVSTKMSNCFRAMGFCCLASVALLAEQVIFYTDEVSLSNKLQWSSRFYPMVIFFLYTMVRAAAVTEKANRVAPLVNSWKFHGEEDGMLSHGRQYAVQYIMQSRAGFYLGAAQLTFPHVQQIVYYFAAISFALFSRLLAD